MKTHERFGRRLFALAFALSISLASTSARAQQSSEPSLITVTGEAQVRVVPDEVVITFGVETSNRDLNTAKSENDARVRRTLALAREMNIEPRYTQTDYLSVEPWYRGGSERPENLEYRVRKTIVITLKDISKFEEMVTRALQAGVTHIHGVQFRTTELRRYRDQARALAITAAREKAVALAGGLGQRIGAAYRINEGGSGWYSPYSYWGGGGYRGGGMSQNVMQEAGGGASGTEGTVALGQITVTASVTVSFTLEQASR